MNPSIDCTKTQHKNNKHYPFHLMPRLWK